MRQWNTQDFSDRTEKIYAFLHPRLTRANHNAYFYQPIVEYMILNGNEMLVRTRIEEHNVCVKE